MAVGAAVTEIVHRTVEPGPVLLLFGRKVQLLLDPFDIGVAVVDDLLGRDLRRPGLGKDRGLLRLLLGGLGRLASLRRLRCVPLFGDIALFGGLPRLGRLALLGVLGRRSLSAV